MNMLDLVILLQPLDWAASIYIVSMWLILSYVIEHPPKSRPSVTVLMSQRRRDWMHA